MQVKPLHDWLAQKGAVVRSMAVAEDGRGGRLVRATAEIGAGEEVLRVPREALLTVEVARKSSVGRRLLEANIDTPSGHFLLAAFLIGEKRRGTSAFGPYIDTLPAAFPTVPLFTPKDSLPILKGTFTASLIVKRRESLCRDLITLRRVVPSFRDVSAREFFWARTAVISRVFGIRVGQGSGEAFVPMADMLNHRRPPDIDWSYEEDQGAFVMRATRDIRAGEELCDSYGRKPNGRYFVHYGFALPEGADDETEVRIHLPADVPRRSAKAAALRKVGGTDGWYRISNRIRNDDTQRTLSILRAMVASEAETGRVIDLLSLHKPISPISPRNEAAALALLDRACAQALEGFESPDLEVDEELLARADLALNVRNAVLVRRGEKRLLHAFRRLCAVSIEMLRLPRKRFFTAAVHYGGEGLTSSYLLETALALAPREARAPISLDR